jgi:hypothetical protein
MKRTLIFLILFIPVCSMGQRFTGGVLLGLNASQIHGDTGGGYHKAGIAAGAFVKTEFREKWGGLLELRYSAKGSAIPSDDIWVKINLQYIEVPVMITYDVFKKFQPQAGVSIGYLFRQTQNYGSGYIIIPDDEGFNAYEVAGCLGIDYKVLDNLRINLRYSLSMIPVQQDFPGATSTRNLEASYNDVLTFAVYYQIGR